MTKDERDFLRAECLVQAYFRAWNPNTEKDGSGLVRNAGGRMARSSSSSSKSG